MKSKLLLASLFSAVALAACGGSGGDATTAVDAGASAAPAPSATPAPPPTAGTATFDATCPAEARKITLVNSTVAGANSSITNDNVTLSLKYPTTAATVTVCPLAAATPGFPATPASLTALLTGTPAAAVVATGSFDLVTNKQLQITFDFGTQTAEAIAAKQMVAYTISAAGAWTRTPLATTLSAGATASSRVVAAPIEQAGFYTIE